MDYEYTYYVPVFPPSMVQGFCFSNLGYRRQGCLFRDSPSSPCAQLADPQAHMSYGLNLGWGGPIGDYVGFWGGGTS